MTFEAPEIEAQDYWQYKQNEQDNYNSRKILLDYDHFEPNKKQTPLPGINDFYQFMSPLLGGKGQVVTTTNETTRNFYRNTALQEHFQDSLNFRSSFVLPQKPIRASVIKLETITRSPAINSPHADPMTPNYYTNVKSILNHVLIENAKNHYKQNFDFPYRRNLPMPVLPKPTFVPKTTENISSRLFNRKENDITETPSNYLKRYNDAYVYPTSALDQLRPLKESVPHLSITTMPYATPILPPDTLSTTISGIKYNENIIFPFGLSNIETRIGIKTVNHSDSKTRANARYKEQDAITDWKSGAFTNFNKSNLKSNNLFKKPEMSNPIQKTSIERLANLTAEGLLKSQQDNLNIQNYINVNIRNLINYERNLENISKSVENKFFKDLPRNKSVLHFKNNVNLNDELSLDAKILKDTNWDGLTTTQSILTATLFHRMEKNFHFVNEMPTEKAKTTNRQMQTFDIKSPEKLEVKKVRDFWETDVLETGENDFGNDEEKTTMGQELLANIEPITLTLEQTNKITTTPLIPKFKSFNETETTPVFSSTEATTMELIFQSITKTGLDSEKPMPTQQINTLTLRNLEMTDATKSFTTLSPKRNYRRRLKTANPSRNSSITERQKKVFNRNRFSKRQKPNITLSIGSKNLLKNKEIYGKHEVMRFSDEDINRGRKRLENRRQVYKKIINANSEKINGD